MDFRKIKKLIELVQESGIAEIEITEGEESVRISAQQPQIAQAPLTYSVPPLAPLNPVAPASGVFSSSDSAASCPMSNQSGYKEENIFKSPMVGVFYRAPSPTAKPFVEVGQEVKAGDILCIIEAMKLMNEIEAEKSGKVTKVLIEDGEPVEYGEALFVIE